jgi:hypothetical protein
MTCVNNTGNVGSLYCANGSIFGKPSGIILAQSSFSQVAANFLLQEQWVDAVQAENVFPIIEMKNFEEDSTDVTYHEYANEDRKLTSQGKYRVTAWFDLTECQKKQLNQFRGFSGLIYFIYGNVVRGRSIDAGVTIVGMRVNDLNVRKSTFPLMDGTPEMVAVDISLKDEADANIYDYSRLLDWDVGSLDSLTDVNLAQVGAASATEVVVSVTGDCYGATYPISGLVIADFAITGTGTLSSLTEVTPGNYTIVTSGLITSDSIDLVAPSALDGDLLIKSAGPVIVTVT